MLFLYEVGQKIKCFPQDIKVDLIIRGKVTIYCGRIP